MFFIEKQIKDTEFQAEHKDFRFSKCSGYFLSGDHVLSKTVFTPHLVLGMMSTKLNHDIWLNSKYIKGTNIGECVKFGAAKCKGTVWP